MRCVLKRPKNTSEGVPVDLVFEKNQKEKNISEKNIDFTKRRGCP